MRLIKVKVEAFQCIESAEVDLAPGLNILYGPNDHGKSTLAAAIRNGLLLQHSSTVRERLMSWHTGDPPTVTISFSTDADRFWRVRKVFGKTGSSTLESSKDGVTFYKDTDARQVDDRLRELLGWGIPKPGGTGNVKGLPESFLTAVLLSEQADVPGILARGLEGDRDDSGRARLNQALQALAQEPLFKKVLDKARSRISKAYTGGGKLSKGKGSPLQEVSQQVNDLRKQQEELQRKIHESTTAEETLVALHQDLLTLETAVAQARDGLSQANEGLAANQARQRVVEIVQAAVREHDQLKSVLEEIQQQASGLKRMEDEIGRLETERQSLQVQEETAGRDCQTARLRLHEATSESGVQEREKQRQALENERLQWQQRAQEVRGQLASARAAFELVEESRQATTELEKLRQQVLELRRTVDQCRAEEAQAAQSVRRFQTLRDFASWREAQRQLAEVRASLTEAEQLDAQAQDLDRKAAELEADATGREAPDREHLGTLSRLERELAVAEARLGGGLSVSLQPRRDLCWHITADGERQSDRSGLDNFEVQAQRTLLLQVQEHFDLVITAGEAQVRQQVDELRRRWSEEAQPWLDRAGASKLEQLQKARESADAVLKQAADWRAQAERLRRQSQERRQRSQSEPELEARVSQRADLLGEFDESALADGLNELGAAWEAELGRLLRDAESARQTQGSRLVESRQRLDGLEGRLSGEETHCGRLLVRANQAAEELSDSPAAMLERLPAELNAWEMELAHNQRQIDELNQQADLEGEAARKACVEAEAILEKVKAERRELEESHQKLRQDHARAAGKLEERQTQARPEDLERAARRVAEAESELVATPGSPFTAEHVAAAERALEMVQLAYRDKEKEVAAAQGALLKVGGGPLRDLKRDLDQALECAMDREHEVEVEYAAWKLLADTLREVENTQGAHLGRAVAGPISQRLEELCAGRYGPLTIDPHLKGEGLTAAGKVRPFDSLSEGTRDQVATLFRLGIAEHLGTAIVLDDHLNQSDARKIEWFLEHLRRTGEKIQVMVITCRPGDYLEAGLGPHAGEVFRDVDGIRVIDLGRAIRRY